MKLGEKIRMIRHLKNFKQETVAELLGMSVNGYGKIERNEAHISIDRLEQIAKVFGTDIKYILDFDEHSVLNHDSSRHPFYASDHNAPITDNERRLYEESISTMKELLKLKDDVIEDLRHKLHEH
jgi:transcriptional regulator with XRE-family HTH domain